MTPEIPLVSPCIGVCRLNPENGRCYGCLRTTAEIAAWPNLAYDEKMALLDTLHERRLEAGTASRRRTRRGRRPRMITD